MGDSIIKTFWIWWKKYGDHLTAPLILAALVFMGMQFYDDNQLKKEVSENCGWGGEDYQCLCSKNETIEFIEKMELLEGREITSEMKKIYEETHGVVGALQTFDGFDIGGIDNVSMGG